MKRSRAYFFTGIDGLTGHRFRVENRPRRSEFEDLFDSIPFILEPADSAQENQSGHIRLETDTRAKGRMAPLSDGWSRSVQGHQLPVVRNQSLAGDVVVSTGVYNGIRITDIDFVDPLTGRVRRDFMVESGLSLTSTDGAFVITPITNGFDLTASPGLADTYKVMGDAGDATPGYLNSKVGNGLTVDGTHRIVPVFDPMPTNVTLSAGVLGFSAQLNYSGTNTIQLLNPGGVLTPNLRYNATWFTEDGTGLRLLPHGITQNEIALGTLLGTNVNVTPGQFFGDGLNHDGTRMYARVQNSIQLDPTGAANQRAMQLVGDITAPGNLMYYGTNGAGVKSWYAISSAVTIPWENDYDNTAVKVKNTNANAHAPRSIALGNWGNTYTPDTIALSTNYYGQIYTISLHGNTGMIASKMYMGNGDEFYLPDDCTAIISGTIVVDDTLNSGDYACWKFTFSVHCVAGIATISSPIVYDTTVAPFHVVQAGVAPYSSPWQTSTAAADIMISCSGADTIVSFDILGIVGPVVTGLWNGCLEINLQLPFGGTYPVYTP